MLKSKTLKVIIIELFIVPSLAGCGPEYVYEMGTKKEYISDLRSWLGRHPANNPKTSMYWRHRYQMELVDALASSGLCEDGLSEFSDHILYVQKNENEYFFSSIISESGYSPELYKCAANSKREDRSKLLFYAYLHHANLIEYPLELQQVMRNIFPKNNPVDLEIFHEVFQKQMQSMSRKYFSDNPSSSPIAMSNFYVALYNGAKIAAEKSQLNNQFVNYYAFLANKARSDVAQWTAVEIENGKKKQFDDFFWNVMALNASSGGSKQAYLTGLSNATMQYLGVSSKEATPEQIFATDMLMQVDKYRGAKKK